MLHVFATQQGKLAKELDFVSHHVRTKLDELKRQEVSRLRTLIKAKQDIEVGNGSLCCLILSIYTMLYISIRLLVFMYVSYFPPAQI